ncbi:hypothetical protein LINPERPRIM_LOCUS24762 [Linum perenne]
METNYRITNRRTVEEEHCCVMVISQRPPRRRDTASCFMMSMVTLWMVELARLCVEHRFVLKPTRFYKL